MEICTVKIFGFCGVVMRNGQPVWQLVQALRDVFHAITAQRHISNELLLAGIFTQHNCALPYLPMLLQSRFNLSEFNTESPDLDLMVYSPQEFESAVRQPARPVAGAIESCASAIRKRIWHEPFRGKIFPF